MCKISDIGQRFTLGQYIGWNCLKTEVLKKRKQSCFVATIGILFAFHAIILFTGGAARVQVRDPYSLTSENSCHCLQWHEQG